MIEQLALPCTEEPKNAYPIEVVPIKLEKHPNADRLSVVRVFGYTCCTTTTDWADIPPCGQAEDGSPLYLAAYIPPDTTVPVNRPEFAFLASEAKQDGRARIKAKRLRGQLSFGLLVPAPAGSHEGDDVAGILGAEHYNPPLPGDTGRKGIFLGGEVASGPNLPVFKYDLLAFRRYGQMLFTPGERVIVTEKIDGCNARFLYHNGQMYCGSRTEWKKEYPDYSHISLGHLLGLGVPEDKAQEILAGLENKPKKQNLWWATLRQTPALEKFCRDHPGVVVYGEIAGLIGNIKYGTTNHFAAFDLLRDGHYLSHEEARTLGQDLDWAPVVMDGEFDFEKICQLAEGNTVWQHATSKVIREGVVIRPIIERADDRLGRVCLKAVSAAYLEKYR